MPTFDWITTVGSLGTQFGQRQRRPSVATSPNAAALTIDTVPTLNNSVICMEYILTGRNTSTHAIMAERGVKLFQNVGATMTIVFFYVIWANAGTNILSSSFSGTNIVLQVSGFAGTTDWQLLTDVAYC